MGKQKAPAPPDYTMLAEASERAAQLSYDLGKEQLDWSREQYNNYWPYVQDFLTSQTASTNENRQRAQEYYDTYQDTYLPLEQAFAQTAAGYATPERMEQRAGMAMADVANTFDAKRRAALSNLESYGIDPSQTRYGALDFSSRIAEAAATAAAGTQSRLNTEGVGLGLMGEAINTGRGYAGNVSQAYTTATQAGAAGNRAGVDLYGTGAGAMGSPTSYISAGNQAIGNWGNAMSHGYSNQLAATQLNNKNNASLWGGIGQLAGGALGFGMYRGYI